MMNYPNKIMALTGSFSGWLNAKLTDIKEIESGGIDFQLDCLLQTFQGASILSGIQDASQLFEGTLREEEGRLSFNYFDPQP